jgi:hypothetical protein
MQNRKDYLTALHGNGQEQQEASTRLIQDWILQTNGLPVPISFILSVPNPLAFVYVLERLHAVAHGEEFLKNNPGQPKQAHRNHEIHRDIERQRSDGDTLEMSVRQTTKNLADGLKGVDKEVLSERSVKNIHTRSTSKTREEWEDFIINRYRELGQTIIDDREK